MRPFFGSPAPAGSELVPAGMLNTIQCHQPLPVGASGSCISSAKLWVPAGAPLQARAGDMLPPLQPNSWNTWALAIVPPAVISVLVRLNLAMAPVSLAAGGAAASKVVPATAMVASQACAVHAVGLMAVAPQCRAGQHRRSAVCSARGVECKSGNWKATPERRDGPPQIKTLPGSPRNCASCS